jgi:citrate lyase subunit beta-like protein
MIAFVRLWQLSRGEESASSIFVHDGLILGGDDFAASLGATRTRDNRELLFARQSMLATARAFELTAIDIVNIHYQDPHRLLREAEEGTRIGIARPAPRGTGLALLHPLPALVQARPLGLTASR